MGKTGELIKDQRHVRYAHIKRYDDLESTLVQIQRSAALVRFPTTHADSAYQEHVTQPELDNL